MKSDPPYYILVIIAWIILSFFILTTCETNSTFTLRYSDISCKYKYHFVIFYFCITILPIIYIKIKTAK